MTRPSKEELLAIVQNFYASSGEALYTPVVGPETQRLHAVWAKRLEDMTPWNDFLDEVERALPGFIVGDTLSTSDGGLRCMLYLPKPARSPEAHWVVVGCVSLLAPVYAVYGVERTHMGNGSRQDRAAAITHAPISMQSPAQVLARKIEATFGATPLSPEDAQASAPLFVGGREPSEATLFHALFTSDPEVIP
ncbi:hypothetical protein [Archangium primigenium]|uniref:hypothetical protein n=1 Tax=[Archangium] primigenium TaxID=2792470 RepID=UPI00195CBF81|nr:hypothetical protein [Archangium primigenium]MBM7118365.1 hypothetical protein [Archangium primigenium]